MGLVRQSLEQPQEPSRMPQDPESRETYVEEETVVETIPTEILRVLQRPQLLQ
jgi:hypothetical protein